ncbi:MAG TPA: M20/M25/M40 family metallo-hydrolase [Kofleriaceae bacterium]|nr:M20/M25/M40 family metallo-hydrolase [Kofleriaceae bacterium]
MYERYRNLIAIAALLASALTVGGCGAFAPEAEEAPVIDRWIALLPGDAEPSLREAGAPIWDREEGIVITGVSTAQLDALHAGGIEPLFSAPDHGEAIHVLSYDRFFTPPDLPETIRAPINDHAMLYLLPAGLEMRLPRLKLHGLFHGVPRVALPPIALHPADVARAAGAAPLAPIGLVQQIVNSTSQASWFQFVRDLSGDSDVTIPGFCTNCRIRTRASDYMFPLNNTGNPLGNPFATEYLENKASGWGFTGSNSTRESYTSANSGCTAAQGSRTWQNVVFTLPGQVDYAQNQQVIFLVHYDTISESAAKDANNAPGADDAISGGSALLEAMRLFKDYAWQHPVKFLFVSGEEVGLCGSTAYTRMHPTGPMWRVVNMDQTAFDGNKNGLMNLYNWSTTSCPSCVAFGDAFVQANADYGNIINPAKIVRNTTKMCQTDHCPFWNVGVTTIDLNEDLTNNDICPCFDQSQSSTCRDTVTQFYPTNSTTLMFDQNYSWPTEKAAIALIAHTAVPLYSCPASGATVSASLNGSQVNVTWADVPPVTNYVVERATGGCGGTFAGIASTATPSYTDNAVTAGSTYGYRVRTCPFQVSNCTAVTIPSTGAVISTTPTSMSFSGTAGGANPASQTLTISNSGTGTLTWTASSNAAWLTQSPTSGTAPSSATVSVSTAGLAAGTYNGAITITAAGASNSPYSVPVTLTVNSSGTNLLLNPGFESGAVNWTATTGAISNTAGIARTGTWAAYMDGYGTTHTDSIYQQVTIPSTSTAAQLCFYLRITTAETTTTTAYDTLKVQLRNSAGTVLTTLATYSNLDKTTFASYSQRCFNVGTYAGQTVRPYFLGAEDSSLQTSFFIDDTSLQ